MRTLKGKTMFISGASRGIGKAIALRAAQDGANIAIAAKTAEAHPKLEGTIFSTAEEIEAAGGKALPLQVDIRDEEAVADAVAKTVETFGGIDILVNNAWGGYEQHPGASFASPFLRQSSDNWTRMFDGGLKATFLTTRHALPLMTGPKTADRPRLIINTVAWAFDDYLGNLYYDVAKAAAIRMVFGLARELGGAEIACIALAPGFVRTERVAQALADDPETLAKLESPDYAGRAVVALAADPDVMERSGRLFTVGDLARDYAFTDTDGRQPPPFRLE